MVEFCSTYLFSFFNIFLYCLAFLLIVAGLYSMLFFLLILIANTTISLVQDFHARSLMLKAKILTKQMVTVVRDGQESSVSIDEIVQDDIVILRESDQVPIDGTILDGKLSVNESLLTGESLPIKKDKGEQVLSGSFVFSGTAYVIADSVGYDRYVEKISKEASKLKHSQSQILRALRIFFRFIAIIVIILAICETATFLVNNPSPTKEEFINFVASAVGSLNSMIPAGLFLLTSTALAVGVINLYKKRTLVQDLYSIENLARTNVLCVDKTGTITDGQMNVKTILPLGSQTNEQIIQIISNMLHATKDDNNTAKALKKVCQYEQTYPVSQVLPFSSINKYSAVTFGSKGTYILGALEMINAINKQGYIQRIDEFTSKGNRVLVLGHSNEKISGDSFEKEVQILALIILEDHIKDDAIETFKWFKENKVEIKVISGDNAKTVSEIAKSVGIQNAEDYISLEGMSNERVALIADKYNVFGRVNPEQKAILVKALKDKKKTVAMTGDGVNDMLALKSADCSIAMASGSAAARNIAHLVLLDSDFSRLPCIVEEGRRVINNLQRTASLYLTKTFFAIILSVFFLFTSWFNKNYTYPFIVTHMYLWEFFTIGVASFFLALERNAQPINGEKFITNVMKKAVFPAICMSVMVIVLFVLYLLRVNGYLYLGISLAPYSDGFDGETIGYLQFIAMSMICFTIFSIAVLYETCAPCNKYRAIVFTVFGALTLITLGVEIVGSYSGKNENIVLNIGFSYLNLQTWLLCLVVLIIALAIYLFVSYFLRVVKGARENDKN